MQAISIKDITELEQFMCYMGFSDECRHFKFHHLGIASLNINESVDHYSLISYSKKDEFTDKNAGVKAAFLTKENFPTLEVLTNLPDCHSLDIYLNNHMSVFHCGYIVDDFEYCFDLLVNKLHCKQLSEVKISSYFKGRCCYILLPSVFIAEIIECKV